MAPWRVADNRSGARDLVTNPVKHAPLHTRDGRSLPIKCSRVHNGALGEVCVEVHGPRSWSMGQPGIVTSWVKYFGPKIAADLRRRRPEPHSIWHLDEAFIKSMAGWSTYGAPSMPKAKSSMF